MALRTWQNGTDAKTVQAIIEHNFKFLGRYLSGNMLCLSSLERKALSDEYLREGLIVYDTTEKVPYKYSAGRWQKTPVEYSRLISTSDWENNAIVIDYTTHLILNPSVQLFIKYDNTYHPVIGGIEVDSASNIILSTDLPFDGKVVIK